MNLFSWSSGCFSICFNNLITLDYLYLNREALMIGPGLQNSSQFSPSFFFDARQHDERKVEPTRYLGNPTRARYKVSKIASGKIDL